MIVVCNFFIVSIIYIPFFLILFELKKGGEGGGRGEGERKGNRERER